MKDLRTSPTPCIFVFQSERNPVCRIYFELQISHHAASAEPQSQRGSNSGKIKKKKKKESNISFNLFYFMEGFSDE